MAEECESGGKEGGGGRGSGDQSVRVMENREVVVGGVGKSECESGGKQGSGGRGSGEVRV